MRHGLVAIASGALIPVVRITRVIVCAIVLLAGAATVTPAIAQSLRSSAIADSADTARTAWRRAGVALRAHDLPGALREINRAATAWPTQPAYVWARANLAARTGDTATTLSALRDYAGFGLGRDVGSDSALSAVTRGPAFRSVMAELEANRSPLVRSHVVARLADSTFWPEGVDYDAKQHIYYVASVRHRTVAALSHDGHARELLPRDQPSFGAFMGVRADPQRGIAWATMSGSVFTEGYTPGDSAIAALVRIDPKTNTIQRRWDIPVVPGGHTLGDLAVGPRGDVFITDSNEPVLYRLRSGADSLEAVRHPLFHNLQGIAPSPDGRYAYVADYSHGLLRLDLRTNDVLRLADAPHTTSLGCDGIAWYRGSIVAVQNGVPQPRIVRFVLNDSGDAIARADVIDRNSDVADEPTIGTIVGDSFVYVANSQWEKHEEDGRVRKGAVLAPPVLLAVPLR